MSLENKYSPTVNFVFSYTEGRRGGRTGTNFYPTFLASKPSAYILYNVQCTCMYCTSTIVIFKHWNFTIYDQKICFHILYIDIILLSAKLDILGYIFYLQSFSYNLMTGPAKRIWSDIRKAIEFDVDQDSSRSCM